MVKPQAAGVRGRRQSESASDNRRYSGTIRYTRPKIDAVTLNLRECKPVSGTERKAPAIPRSLSGKYLRTPE